MREGPTAALLVRVWLEDGPATFRARLTSLSGPGGDGPPEEVTVTASASPSEVVEAVSAWLAEFLRHGQTD